VTAHEGLERLATVLRKPPRFGPVGTIAGHTVLTVGVALVLMPALTNIAAAAALGAIVGVAKLLAPRQALFAVPMPVVAAALVSALVFYAARHGLPLAALHILVPPLVTFLPGAMLTLGMTELAYGEMVAGASRLTTGFVQLFLLAFGLAAGAGLVGVGPDTLVESTEFVPLPWAAWAGVVVFGLGCTSTSPHRPGRCHGSSWSPWSRSRRSAPRRASSAGTSAASSACSSRRPSTT
jgi:hypothetical protein